MRELLFDPNALEDLRWWVEQDRRTALKVLALLGEIRRTPFAGKGKPEALKHELAGCWSRRITQEHRLVYQVSEQTMRVLACRFHYR